MRQITLDVETTGLSTKDGDRIIEIGCVEIIDRVITGKVFHAYCNPERPVGEVTTKITGIKDEFLADKPKFEEIVEDFLNFIRGSVELIIHNAVFDLEFINNELKLLNHTIQDLSREFTIVDTLVLARIKHPKQRNSLDALSKRYNVNFARELHGALLDARILASLMLKMTAGQISLDFDSFNNNLIENNIYENNQAANAKCDNNAKGKYIENINFPINNFYNQFHNANDVNKSHNQRLADISDLKIIYADSQELALHEKYFK